MNKINTGNYRAVLGFAFRAGHVYLLKKNRGPDVVIDLINGLGGKAREGESDVQAMVREFSEEGGAGTTGNQWRHFCTLYGTWGKVRCFVTKLTDRQDDQMMTGDLSLTSERVGLYDPLELPNEIVPNLAWLIPMSQDLSVGEYTRVHVK